jgi:UDP-N-acetylmuramoyl-L-alanyl-D-glutamate--2,6-diaminopimelate ligase
MLPSMLTTPEAPDLQALLAVMVQRGVRAVAMEVSSHALVQRRVDGTRYAVGAFTNLSQDHLDFHGDMESYFAAKRLLFDGRAGAEVVVVDDDYGRRLAADRPAAVTVSTRPDSDADWTARARPGPSGSQQLLVRGPHGMSIDVAIALPGPFNVANAVTALACVSAAGVDPVLAAGGLAAVQVPGRMERVDRGQPFLALVDYAHKPAALAAVLAAVRRHGTGRLILVVGAGGDRDVTKRPVMGQVAAAGADLVIVTDDNPRSEDPAAIRAQLLAGARSGNAAVVREIGDRREAIGAAVRAAGPGDVLVIAGKGHELGQEIAGVVHPFSDRDELAAALAAVVGPPSGASSPARPEASS